MRDWMDNKWAVAAVLLFVGLLVLALGGIAVEMIRTKALLKFIGG